jgi:hypothetical protein
MADKSINSGQKHGAVDLRQAEMEYLQRNHDAVLEYQYKAASVFADYRKTMRDVAQDAASKGAAAYQQAMTASGTLEQRAEAARALRQRTLEISAEAQKRAHAAARKLAEDQMNSWYDAAEKRRDAFGNYLRAVQAGFADGALTRGIAVAGDEGMDPTVAVSDPGWGYFGELGFVDPALIGLGRFGGFVGGAHGLWASTGFRY